jgi:hypothetical protein
MTHTKIQHPGITVSCIANKTAEHRETGETMDLALVALAFVDERAAQEDDVVDALVIVRNRATGQRTVRHFPREPLDMHFQRAVDFELEILAAAAPIEMLDSQGLPVKDAD